MFSTLKRMTLPLLLALAGGLGTSSCQVLSNLNMYSTQDDVTLGLQAFQQVTAEQNIVTSGPDVAQVKRVTDRLVAAAVELKPEIASQFEWEVVVIDAPDTVNAFCLPGGKMAVYTGILPVAKTDAGLAVVMGHEIAHATERHGTERLTRNGLMSGAIDILAQNEDQRAIANILGNLGVGLPWSRSNELEADHEGLFIMAQAGYDPREGPVFWQRMSQLGGGGGSGFEEYLSTHPSHDRRIEQLTALIPEVLPVYEAAVGKN